MAFTEKTIIDAWEKSGGQCECERRNHAHFYTPCGKSLAWKARGTARRGGWEAHQIVDSGGNGLHNCEILCWECYKSASGYVVPSLFSASYFSPMQSIRRDEDAVADRRISRGYSSKRAKESFQFYSLALLRKMTGLKARNLVELVGILKKVPESVVYYHTHQFLQEHDYLTPEPANDFAIWVADSLGDELLGERLASVNPFSFPDLGGVREKLVNIIEEHAGQYPNQREANEGKEFYFVKSARFIFPTPYIAYDLKEFVEALSKISLGSLYFHIFESRLKSPKGLNDFSIWLMESLGEEELGRVIARLDPYTYTLEGLRSLLIKLIEKRTR